jgi:hypothetical protein
MFDLAADAFPSVFGFGIVYRLPLHIFRAIQPIASQWFNVVYYIARTRAFVFAIRGAWVS